MPPKKTTAKKSKLATNLAPTFEEGTCICDVLKKHWILEKAIGQGGFGVIYSARFGADENRNSDKCVVKIEPHGNGPLFCEMNFYIRAARAEQLETWKTNRRLDFVGVLSVLGHGSYKHENVDFRFLVLPLLGKDLQAIWRSMNCRFGVSTACQVAVQAINALEYIHSTRYSHADVKGANLLLDGKNQQRIFLVDFGLAECYTESVNSDTHRVYKVDPKRCHNGTSDYCSRDAHSGVIVSRRGDLESLLWSVLEWVGGELPWSACLQNRSKVAEIKEMVGKNPRRPLDSCGQLPLPFFDFMENVLTLKYEEMPDYDRLRNWLRETIKISGGNSSPGALQLDTEPIAQVTVIKRGLANARKKKSAVRKRQDIKRKTGVLGPLNSDVTLGAVSSVSLPSKVKINTQTALKKELNTTPVRRSQRNRTTVLGATPDSVASHMNHSPDLFAAE